MNKYLHNKAITFIVLIVLVFTCNTGISLADTNLTYPNSQNLIEKLSHPASGEGKTDGILPEEGDRGNSYTWTQAQLGDYVYIGSNRNLLATTFLQVTAGELDPGLTLKFLNDISNGDIPTENITDTAARMFRYNMTSKTFEEIYKNPSNTGYRGALTFKPEGAANASVYFGSLGGTSQVLRFGSDFKVGDTPEVVYSAIPGYASIRAMTEHNGSMCIGVLTISSGAIEGNLQIMQATNPAIGDAWKEIASIEDFAPCNPRTDAGAAAQSGVWDMVSYNGSIYAFIGTGYVNDSKTNGYSVFKGTYLPEEENANKEGWVWKMIVGPLEDGNGDPTGAIYPRGMGNQYDGSASPFLYTDPNGETYVYVGTFDSAFESIFEILSENSYESLYHAMHPAKIYRFDKNDNWEMVIGNPDEYFSTKLGNYYAGFSSTTQASVYSPNLYVWRMAQYNGELFAGTFDGTTLMDIIVPPFDIDFDTYDDDDLVTILNMDELGLPDELVKALTEAVKYADTTSEAAVKSQKIYTESEEVLALGNEALAAANDACDLVPNFFPGAVLEKSGDLYDAIMDCKDKSATFTGKATAAAVNTTLAAATATLSDVAAKSASTMVTDWETAVDSLTPYNDGLGTQIYDVRDDVSAAVNAAQIYRDQAKTDSDKATEQATSVAAIITDLRGDLTEVSGKVNKLFATITVEQYTQMSDLLATLDDLGYGTGEFQELRYILELRAMINTNKIAGGMGCSVYRTSDGLNFTPITTNGFNDKYNYGLRTFLSTSKGLFMGMANPFYGAQLWRLGDLVIDGGGNGGGGGGGSSTGTAAATESAIHLGPLNMTDHFAYIRGYEDGTIRPLDNMTRAEVAMTFYRLLTEESRAQYQTNSNSFSDVSSADWFSTAVSTLAKANILSGYKDGTFLPNAIMTRAEFATIMSRITEVQSGSSRFTDISEHWAKNYINTAYSNNWVSGYSDDTFRPNQPITRAEVMTMVNRALQRMVKASDMLDSMTKWSDNLPGAWYYEAVQEATNSHNYTLTTELVPGQSYYYEKWTELTKNPDWSNPR